MSNIFTKAQKELKLSPEEKGIIRAHLAIHAQKYPHGVGTVRSPFARMRTKRALAGVVLASMLLGGSVSFAAEQAVPGDRLYPVKVRVNEPLRGVVALSEQSRADWEVRMAERRLEEVEILNTKRKAVSEKNHEFAAKNFEAYAEKVNARIQKLDTEGRQEEAARVAERFVSRVRAREEKIAQHAEKKHLEVSTSPKQQVKDFERVRAVRERIEHKREMLNKESRE